MNLHSQGKPWDLGTCLQLALRRRGRYSCHWFICHLWEIFVKLFKQHHVGMQSGWEPVEKQWHSSWLVWRTNYGMESYTSGSSLHIHLSCILATRSLLFDSSLVTDMKWLCRSRPLCSALVSSLEHPVWQGLIDLCIGSVSRDLRADLLGNGIQIWCTARGQPGRRLSHQLPCHTASAASQRTENPSMILFKHIRHGKTKWASAKDR